MTGIKKAEINIDGKKIRIAVAHTLKNAKVIMDKIRAGECEYDFFEVMACPGGCLGGGGQPVDTTMAVNKKRMEALYTIDKNTKYRKSHENPYLKKLYAEFLEKQVVKSLMNSCIHITMLEKRCTILINNHE